MIETYDIAQHLQSVQYMECNTELMCSEFLNSLGADHHSTGYELFHD